MDLNSVLLTVGLEFFKQVRKAGNRVTADSTGEMSKCFKFSGIREHDPAFMHQAIHRPLEIFPQFLVFQRLSGSFVKTLFR